MIAIETVFHSRIPSLTVSACRGLRRWAVTVVTKCASQTPISALCEPGGELRQAAGAAAGDEVDVTETTPTARPISLYRRRSSNGRSDHGLLKDPHSILNAERSPKEHQCGDQPNCQQQGRGPTNKVPGHLSSPPFFSRGCQGH